MIDLDFKSGLLALCWPLGIAVVVSFVVWISLCASTYSDKKEVHGALRGFIILGILYAAVLFFAVALK